MTSETGSSPLNPLLWVVLLTFFAIRPNSSHIQIQPNLLDTPEIPFEKPFHICVHDQKIKEIIGDSIMVHDPSQDPSPLPRTDPSFFTYLVLSTPATDPHTDSTAKTPTFKDIRANTHSETSRRLESDATPCWHKMKIEIDMERFDGSGEEKRIIIDFILPKVIGKLEKNIQVFGKGVLPPIKNTSCDKSFTMSEKYQKNSTNADLILVVEYLHDDTNYLAYAVPCYLDYESKRPIVGLISMNSKNFKAEPSTLMENYYTILHEIFHILAITPPLFSYYLNQPVFVKSSRSSSGTQIILPKVRNL